MTSTQLKQGCRLGRFALLVLVAFGLLVSVAWPAPAGAAVSGQQESWDLEFGTDPGQFFNATSLGVDPVDGSVYVLDEEPGGTAFRIDKFTAEGAFKGSVTLSTTAEPGATAGRRFVGIAVNHSLGEFYVVVAEQGLDAAKPNLAVATKILAFKTAPEGASLVPAATPSLALPAPDDAGTTLLVPYEIHLDPTDGDLVISGQNEAGHIVLLRVSSAGVELGRYEETGALLRRRGPRTPNFGFAIGADGTTYLVANTGELEFNEAATEAFSLPPDLGSTSTLMPLPGFEDAAIAGGWETDPFALVLNEPTEEGAMAGPAVAVGTAPDGEETPYWKNSESQTTHESIRIHGWSLQQQRTVAGFGGGALDGPCSIETREAALAATKNGNLVVLAQGQWLSGPSGFPAWPPQLLRFGPGNEFGTGSSTCPDPAPTIELETGAGAEVSSVPAGATVKLDASASELGGFTPSKLVWTVTKSGGTPETIPATGTPPAEVIDHVFTEEGEYTVQLALTVSEEVPYMGPEFSSRPVKVIVTSAAEAAPEVTAVDPTKGLASGGNTVTIEGTDLEAASAVEFGGVATTVTEDTATKLVATAPPGTAGQKVHVTVTTAAGTSMTGAADEYEYEPLPAVTSIAPTHGPAAGGTAVTITGTGLEGATVDFGTAAATITEETATRIVATAPPGAAASKVTVTVTTSAGTSVAGAADEFTYDVPTYAVTVTSAGTGTGTVTCNGLACGSYPAGTRLTLAATPASGSTFGGWGGACTGTGACTLTIDADKSVVATFAPTSQGGGDTGGGSSGGGQSGGGTPGGGGSSGGGETKAQKLAEQRKKALKKCTKLHGTAKTQCVKKAHQIGKRKPKKKAHK